jgi:hypothetical protein
MRLPVLPLLAAALAAAPLSAQRPDAPLGELIEAIPLPEQEAPPSPGLPERPRALPPGGVGTAELPPSQADVMTIVEPEAEAAAEPNPWELERERRRAEVNEEESPITTKLNEEVTARHEAIRRANEEAAAAHRRALEAREAAARRAEAEHRAALEAHRREVERQRAAYEAQVAACLADDRTQCAPPTPRR